MKFISDITVTPIQSMGGDSQVVAAAKVSTSGEEAAKFVDKEANYGLINYLMKHRHGTPFEHGAMTFFVHAPIFVYREWHRHRVGFSYNEESGRYKTLDPVFWIPRADRKLVPVPDPGATCNKCDTELKKLEAGVKFCGLCNEMQRFNHAARPYFQTISEGEHAAVVSVMKEAYASSYKAYEDMINAGIAKEAARAVLPVGIFSSCWVTTNPRALMHFLSLRTHDTEASFVSYPQAEIEEAARVAEQFLSTGWPMVYKAFCENGRVGA
jgi:thymidylate synthase (FAD)